MPIAIGGGGGAHCHWWGGVPIAIDEGGVSIAIGRDGMPIAYGWGG